VWLPLILCDEPWVKKRHLCVVEGAGREERNFNSEKRVKAGKGCLRLMGY
jgi:hypothetical protein